MKFQLNYNGTIGDFIKEFRQIAKISSRELSRRIGQSSSYISLIENGYNKKPSYEALYKIFEEIGVPKNRIEDYLEHFGFYSKRREKKIAELELKKLEVTEEEYNAYLESEKQLRLNHPEEFIDNNDPLIEQITEDLIEKIASNLKNRSKTLEGFTLIKNLEQVLSNSEKYDDLFVFLNKFLDNNLHYLDEEGMVRVINSLYEEMNRVEKLNDEWGVAEIKEFIDKIN